MVHEYAAKEDGTRGEVTEWNGELRMRKGGKGEGKLKKEPSRFGGWAASARASGSPHKLNQP